MRIDRLHRFTAARRLRRLSVIALLLAAVACWFGVPALRQTPTPSAAIKLASHEPTASTPSAAPSALPAKRIEDIQLGGRVAGTNPLREQAELIEPDEETWREVQLRLKKEDGGLLYVNLLRPVAWFEAEEVTHGRTIYLDMPEMGAVGDADVLAVLPCPKIDCGDGAVVTGQFRHEVTNGEIVELRLEGKPGATRVTANHPYWSKDRQDFIPVGELHPGEQLETLTGPARVALLTRVPYSGALYNLETTEHVYRVDEFGTLVHNSCHGHHPIPKFLGGHKKQIKSYIDPTIHIEFHVRLKYELKKAGFQLNIGGRGGAKGDWLANFARHSGSQRLAIDVLKRVTRSIDQKYGTRIMNDLMKNLRRASYEVVP